MRGFDMGQLYLEASGGKHTEACLTLVTSTMLGTQVFDNLSNIRFTLEHSKGPANTREAQPPAVNQVKKGSLPTKAAVLGGQKAQKSQRGAGSSSGSSGGSQERPVTDSERPGSLYAYDWITYDSVLEAAAEELHPFLAATAAMKRVERDAFRSAAARRAKEGHFVREAGAVGHLSHNSSSAQSGWEQLRQEYLWPDGQGVLESLFTPYESEGIYMCKSCQPNV